MAVYIHGSEVLEVYHYVPLRDGHDGVLDYIGSLQNVSTSQLEELCHKDYYCETYRATPGEGLHIMQTSDKTALEFILPKKKKFHKSAFQPVKLADDLAEKRVSNALKDLGVRGGCWKSIYCGQRPSADPNYAEGFRTITVAMTGAGLAAWYDSNVTEYASWFKYVDIFLRDDRNLTIGHCETGALQGLRSDQKKSNTGTFATIIASKKSPVWKISVMWGQT